MANLVSLIKQASIEAVNTTSPVKLVFGTVLDADNLLINIEQKLTLTKEHLILTNTSNNTLATGDKVILVQMQGGQKYVVLDRVVD